MCDWIHCNKCFFRFRSHIKFYITTCAHLKCQICVSKMDPKNRCLVCGSVCEIAELSNNLKPDILCFFQPAVETIDKANQVCEFQLKNILSLLRKMTTKYVNVKAEITKNIKTLQELQRRQHKLKMMLKSVACTVRGTSSASISSENTPANVKTPISNTSSSYSQFQHSNLRPLPWNQRQNAARMMMQRQYPEVRNIFSSPSDTSYSVSQEHSFAAPFDLTGSPNEHHGPLSSRNTFTGHSMSNHPMALGNKSR